MSRARDNADLGDSYGSLAVGVTGGSGLDALSASNLSAGTVPDARFPGTLPATSGVNLTAINATNLGSGTVPDARFPATLPAASGANLTALPAANVTGVLPVGVSADHLKVLTEVDQWRINTNFTSDATPLTANWTRVNKVGTGFAAPTSGVFSFPSTGFWWVLFETYGAKDSGASIRLNAYIEGAADKSGSYSTIAQGKQSTSSGGFGQVHAQCIFECTSIHGTTGSAVRMNVEAAGASTFEGDSSVTATSVTFLKLGDT